MILDTLISRGNRNVDPFLKEAIKHNQKIRSKLEELTTENVNDFLKSYDLNGKEVLPSELEEFVRASWSDLVINEDVGTISFRTQPINGKIRGLKSNLITVSATPVNQETGILVEDLNSIYRSIVSHALTR